MACLYIVILLLKPKTVVLFYFFLNRVVCLCNWVCDDVRNVSEWRLVLENKERHERKRKEKKGDGGSRDI